LPNLIFGTHRALVAWSFSRSQTSSRISFSHLSSTADGLRFPAAYCLGRPAADGGRERRLVRTA
jgi:hypothetical protein